MSYINLDMKPIHVLYNHINLQVFQLLEDLEAAGETVSPRGLKTKQANLATLDINPLFPIIDFKPRKFNFRYFSGELAWYLKGDNDVSYINNFSSFWNNITLNGKVNSNYGSLLLKSHPSTLYSEDANGFSRDRVNQLEWVYNTLVKDKHSRQAVAFLNCPYFQYEGNKDFVCTMYINFFISKDHLDMKVQMRSNDIYFGLTYDAPWFSTIHQSMFLNLKQVYPELKLGMYYHCADNIHFYERHFELTNQILDSDLESSLELKLKEPIFIFKNGNLELSNVASKFIETVDSIVESGNITKDQLFWKETLSSLYEIGG